MQLLYAPYQSRSVIIDPRQRGQLRGAAASIEVAPEWYSVNAGLVAGQVGLDASIDHRPKADNPSFG
jgi:hypothetical protein